MLKSKGENEEKGVKQITRNVNSFSIGLFIRKDRLKARHPKMYIVLKSELSLYWSRLLVLKSSEEKASVRINPAVNPWRYTLWIVQSKEI